MSQYLEILTSYKKKWYYIHFLHSSPPHSLFGTAGEPDVSTSCNIGFLL